MKDSPTLSNSALQTQVSFLGPRTKWTKTCLIIKRWFLPRIIGPLEWCVSVHLLAWCGEPWRTCRTLRTHTPPYGVRRTERTWEQTKARREFTVRKSHNTTLIEPCEAKSKTPTNQVQVRVVWEVEDVFSRYFKVLVGVWLVFASSWSSWSCSRGRRRSVGRSGSRGALRAS